MVVEVALCPLAHLAGLRDPYSAKPYVLFYTTKRQRRRAGLRRDQAVEVRGELNGAKD